MSFTRRRLDPFSFAANSWRNSFAVGKTRMCLSCLPPLARIHLRPSCFLIQLRAYLVSLATSDARGVSKNDDGRTLDDDREQMIAGCACDPRRHGREPGALCEVSGGEYGGCAR